MKVTKYEIELEEIENYKKRGTIKKGKERKEAKKKGF